MLKRILSAVKRVSAIFKNSWLIEITLTIEDFYEKCNPIKLCANLDPRFKTYFSEVENTQLVQQNGYRYCAYQNDTDDSQD